MKTATHKAPSWMCADSLEHWRTISNELWATRRPTPLERIAGAILAEEMTLAEVHEDPQVRRYSSYRVQALMVALRMEPIAQAKRKAS